MKKRFRWTLWLCLVIATFVSAADKSGVTPNTISLPGGPGSIEGLGQTFQPTLNTGTAKYGIDLELPPGTAGHAPSLSLSYDGGGANGCLGFGWQLPLAYVQRKTEDGVPLYMGDSPPTLGDDWSDRYDSVINELKEDLVPASESYWYCRNEGPFVRYEKVAGHWRGRRPAGKLLEFGVTAAGRIDDGQGRVFTWLLERSTDTHGNTILYTYRSFPGAENLNQKYLSGIRYGPGEPPWDNFHFVEFVYEARPDWFEDCRPGFPVRTGMRLQSILVGTQGPALSEHLAGDFYQDGTTDYLTRRYDLGYVQYAGVDSHWSLLATVTLVGADGTTALPAETFGYTISHPPASLSAAGHVLGGDREPLRVVDDEQVDFVDLNADGLPDILRTFALGGAHQVFLNRGVTEAAGRRLVQWSDAIQVGGDALAWGVNLETVSNTAHLSDMDGDGLADLVYRSPLDEVYYFPNRILSWGSRRRMSVMDFSPPSPFAVPGVKTADMDGDKRMDIIQSVDAGSGADYRIWFNLGNQTYAQSTTVPQVEGKRLSDTGVQIVDVNGDRLADVVHIRPTAIEVLRGVGYGRFASKVVVALPDRTLDSSQIARAKMTDITGDGLADLVIERPAPQLLWFWVNLGNFTFSPIRQITDLPLNLSITPAIRWADLNGNGSTDLVYADSLTEPRMQTVDLGELLTGGLPPNLLTNIANGLGRLTGIDYRSSVDYALRDAAEGQTWPDPLPKPVHVVSRVTTSDSLGNSYETHFAYHDGFYDSEEKQFRGFARVEQIQVGGVACPTLVTRHRFDTGRDHEIMKGRLLFQAAETEDGGVFWEETTSWELPPRVLHSGTEGEDVVFTHRTSTVRVVKELGQGVERRLESEFGYDDYGNEIRNANYGVVENGDRSAFNDERIVTTEYAYNTNLWLVRLPSRTEVADEQGGVISRVEYYYDDETFSAGNLGEVTRGDPTLERRWIDPESADSLIAALRTKYDRYGNAATVFDPLGAVTAGEADLAQGHVRTMLYDDDFQTYPVAETVHVGNGSGELTFEASYDPSHGNVLAATDFNGYETRYAYDALGRLVSVTTPPDEDDFPTVEYRYLLAVPHGPEGLVNYIETRQLDSVPGRAGQEAVDHYFLSREYFDGLGRKLMSKIEAQPAGEDPRPRVVVKQATRYNARQESRQVLNPYFSALPDTALEELLRYEDIGATGWTGWFQDETGTRQLGLLEAPKLTTDYDATLRTVRIVNQDGSTRSHVYHPLTSFMYDENDLDPGSAQEATPMIHHKDGLDRLIGVEEVVRLNDEGEIGPEAFWLTRYEYDVNDQLIRVTDAQNNVRAYVYDGLQRRISVRDPNSGTLLLRYDEASNLIESIDAKGQRITYTYDGANRTLTEDFHDELSDVSHGYIYDPGSPLSAENRPDVAFFYDTCQDPVSHGDGDAALPRNVKGRMAGAWDLSGEQYFSYDERGREEWVVRRVLDPRASYLADFRTAYTYDSFNRMTRVVYPDNDHVEYAYNRRGLLAAVTGAELGPVIQRIDYHPSGQETAVVFGNSTRVSYSYDNRLRLVRNATLREESETGTEYPLLDLAYDYDPFSNLTGIHDHRPPNVLGMGQTLRVQQQFVYDDLYRLVVSSNVFVSTSTSQPTTATLSYRYDRIGNMLTSTKDGDAFDQLLPSPPTGEMTSGGGLGRWGRGRREVGDPAGPHALTKMALTDATGPGEKTFPYDDNGNLLEVDGVGLYWDFKNRLVRAADDNMSADYVFDYADRRVLKAVREQNGESGQDETQTTTYVNRHFEVREPNTQVKYVWKGNARIARSTRTLSATSNRVQRVWLEPGWNLVSAVPANVTLPAKETGALEEAYLWEEDDERFRQVLDDEPLPAGAVLWIKAAERRMLALTGDLVSHPNTHIPEGRAFVPLRRFELVAATDFTQRGITLWRFNAFSQQWQVRHPTLEFGLPGPPARLSGGETVFVHSPSAAQLSTLPSPVSLRFYHQDHLGSVSLTTDGEGHVVSEVCRYAFGLPQLRWQPQGIGEDYGFGQKERDTETGLHYFEARFLSSGLGRFITVDPLGTETPVHWLTSPQMFNAYSYARNNPINLTDPTGMESVGEWLYNTAGQAADEGSMGKAYALGIAWTAWETVGFEGVSKLENKRIHGKEITTEDVVVAALEVATVGKGGGVLGKGLSKLGKFAGKGAKLARGAGQAVRKAVRSAGNKVSRALAKRAQKRAARAISKRARALAKDPSRKLFEPLAAARLASDPRRRVFEPAIHNLTRDYNKLIRKQAGEVLEEAGEIVSAAEVKLGDIFRTVKDKVGNVVGYQIIEGTPKGGAIGELGDYVK